MKLYDAENQILGRMSSKIAKELLNGEEIVVVNCEKSVLAGKSDMKKGHYMQRVKRGNPIHGPFFPKQPDGIFRRTVRGMLPWDKTRGREAYGKLKVFVGVPPEMKGAKFEKVEEADAGRLKVKYTMLGEISEFVGAKKRW